MVEAVSGLARVILAALMREEPPCRVIVKHDGVEALDYLLCRGAYAGRDPSGMPCVTLVDLALPDYDGLGLLREMRAHEQTKLSPWSHSLQRENLLIDRLMKLTLRGPTATSA